MNFLFYLLGRAHRSSFARPDPRQALLAQAAVHAAHANLPDALRIYRRLPRITPLDLLIRAHLHLLHGNHTAAHHDFSHGIARLLARDPIPTDLPPGKGRDPAAESGGGVPAAKPTAIEHLLSHADSALRRGRYIRAAELLQQTRSLLDTLLAAHAGLLLIAERRAPGNPQDLALAWLVPLAKLSDITLRLLARAHLATHLSDSLRRRQLRDDLAPWAVSNPSIDHLLDAEYTRLSDAARQQPSHAELHYRRALAARATARPDQAAAAFSHTLALHPFHVPSAARLVATRRQLLTPSPASTLSDPDDPSLDLAPLHQAFHIPGPILQTFAAFARASGNAQRFDRAADRLCLLAPDDNAAAATRANLAFALAELALFSPSLSPTFSPAPCSQT